MDGLRGFGWIEGQNISIELRFAAGDETKTKLLAAEFERLKLDVVTATLAATKAMHDLRKTVPIVFIAAGDPVGQGFVKSLSHPRGEYHWRFF